MNNMSSNGEISEKTNTFLTSLNKLYDYANDGKFGMESVPALVSKFKCRYGNSEDAIDAYVKWQVAKCTTIGFVTGLPGFLTMPISIPLDLSSSLFIQVRMISVIAQLRGYSSRDEEVRTFVFLALCANGATEVAKSVGIKFGVKYFSKQIMKQVTGKTLSKINRAVGLKFITKRGSKGLIRLSSAAPIIGGVVSGGFNFVETKIIASTAKKIFVSNENI